MVQSEIILGSTLTYSLCFYTSVESNKYTDAGKQIERVQVFWLTQCPCFSVGLNRKAGWAANHAPCEAGAKCSDLALPGREDTDLKRTSWDRLTAIVDTDRILTRSAWHVATVIGQLVDLNKWMFIRMRVRNIQEITMKKETFRNLQVELLMKEEKHSLKLSQSRDLWVWSANNLTFFTISKWGQEVATRVSFTAWYFYGWQSIVSWTGA